MSLIDEILRDNRFTSEDLPGFEKKLFFEGPRLQPYLVRFTVLLFLSTIIAAFGVINDSTAIVIGAMIIAPLMTPIMATAAALVMGKMDRSLRSLLYRWYLRCAWSVLDFRPASGLRPGARCCCS